MSQPVVIITGAGRGIGRATAQQLARDGCRLSLVARSTAELDETSRLCGGGIVAPADVSDIEAVQAVVDKTLREFGRVDALVHNAGYAVVKSIEQLTPPEWQAIIDTNLSAAYYFCRALWPIWRRQQGGVAVFVSSVAARDPFPGLGAYGASKAALNLLALALAREGAEIGVRVHAVAPGAVETVMLRAVVTSEQLPTERTLDPADVARVIAQCVRGDLRHTSGEVIYVHKTV